MHVWFVMVVCGVVDVVVVVVALVAGASVTSNITEDLIKLVLITLVD